jgi:tetratricopeptide (TPR) repeat protein
MGSLAEDPEVGLGYLRRSIAVNPNYALGWLQMAELLVGRGREDPEVLQTIDAALRLDPLEPRLHYLRGLYQFMERGDVAEAEKNFRATLAVNPEYYVALARLGQLHACCLGKQAEAVRYAEQALRLDPQARWVRRLLVGLYLDLDERTAAEHVARETPVAEAGATLLLDLARNDRVGAVRRLVDPANAAALNWFETSESHFFGRLALLTPRNTAAMATTLAKAAERVLPGRGVVGAHLNDQTLAHVDHAALLLASGSKAQGEQQLRAALADLNAAGASGHDLALGRELRLVALALDGQNAAALQLLEDSTRDGPWPYWWYYARLEPTLDGLRSEPRFQAWAARTQELVLAEREKLRALRGAGVIPRRAASDATT